MDAGQYKLCFCDVMQNTFRKFIGLLNEIRWTYNFEIRNLKAIPFEKEFPTVTSVTHKLGIQVVLDKERIPNCVAKAQE